MAQKIKVNCSKCNGTGNIGRFKHYANGECFQCEGKGYQLKTQYQIEQDEKEIQQLTQDIMKEEQQFQEWVKENDRKNEQRKQENIKNYQDKLDYYGSVGDIVELELNIKKIQKTKYATMYILNNENHTFVLYEKETLFKFNPDTLKVKATIKEHKEFNGFKQTVLKSPQYFNAVKESDANRWDEEDILYFDEFIELWDDIENTVKDNKCHLD